MSTTKAKAQPITSKGIALVLVAGIPALALTEAPDGTFGWRTHGKANVKTRNGGTKRAYKFGKGYSDYKTALAAGIMFLKRHNDEIEDASVTLSAYVAPERAFGGAKKMIDSEEFKASLKLASKLKLPKALQLHLSNGIGQKAAEKSA